MRSRSFYLFIFISSICFKLKAQDPHFSQYYASPLTVNPANTGFFDGDYRFAINERQQWWNVGSNYNTTSVSVDVKVLKDYLPPDDTFGIGFSGVFDNSLNGALQSNYMSASGAYHKSLDGNQTLSVGLQVTMTDRYFDLNKVSFASQFNVDYFDQSIPVNLNYNNSSTRYVDVSAGLLYSFHINESSFYAGASLYHANRPVESLFDPAGDKVSFRGTFHTGADIRINAKSSILYSGIFMSQGAVTDQLVGAAYGLKASNDYGDQNYIRLYAGLWYRIQDSYIPYLGIDYNNFSVGVNYSIPESSVVYTYRPNTFEMSLIYRIKFNPNQSALCPRF